ncbi:MAG: glutamate-1-semialdehyde 2,1-aminomutase [Planctomycetota bacterium]|jgi:glutamate-1-semialdehyde 2,1-aminomutase
MASSEPTATNSRYDQSRAAHARATELMPGGVSSPVRAYKSVGLDPIVIRDGEGCRVRDLDGNSYIDYVLSYGPLIAGHAHPAVVAAVSKAVSRGTSFGMPSEGESQLAEQIINAIDSVDLVRFVNSGTEATMSAVRVARGATGRAKMVKCVGGYHGHADSMLVSAGSGASTLGVPSSPGVPPSVTTDTLLMPYNDLTAAAALFDSHGADIACVIIEPVAGNMGCVPPIEGYLQGLRDLCDKHGAILIFDEVMCGFRVAYGGAQSIYGVTPDLTCLGKVVGGGLPCAAYGGKEELMRQVAPDGPIYQAGTLSGNPVAMAAGSAMLDLLSEPGAYEQLEAASARLETGLRGEAAKAGAAIQINRVGSMLTVFFTDQPVNDYDAAVACDMGAFSRFFASMLHDGVALPPSQYEALFVSLLHDDKAIDQTIAASVGAFASAVGG